MLKAASGPSKMVRIILLVSFTPGLIAYATRVSVTGPSSPMPGVYVGCIKVGSSKVPFPLLVHASEM